MPDLPSTGGIVYVAPGTYVGPTAAQWKSNVSLIAYSFDPPQTILHGINSLWPSAADVKAVFTYSAPLVLDSLSSVRLDGIQFDFSSATTKTDGVQWKGCNNFQWENFSIYGDGSNTGIGLRLTGQGVSVNSTSNNFFRNFMIAGFVGGTITLEGVHNGPAVTANAFYNSWLVPGFNSAVGMIQAIAGCDGNYFYATTLTGLYDNTIAIAINPSTPSTDQGTQLVFYGVELQNQNSTYVGPFIQINKSHGSVFHGVDVSGSLTGTDAQKWAKITGTSNSPQFSISFSSNFSIPSLSSAIVKAGTIQGSGTGVPVQLTSGAFPALPGDLAAGRSATVGSVYFGLDGGAIFRSGNTYFFGGAHGTAGVGFETVETTAQTPILGSGIIWPESTTHRWSVSQNGNPTEMLVTDAGQFGATAQSADVGYQVVLASPPTTGFYRCTAYAVVTRAATSSSNLPAFNVGWTDADSNTSVNTNVGSTASGNTVGTMSSASFMVYAKAGTNIDMKTTGYASSGATSMQFAVHFVVERV